MAEAVAILPGVHKICIFIFYTVYISWVLHYGNWWWCICYVWTQGAKTRPAGPCWRSSCRPPTSAWLWWRSRMLWRSAGRSRLAFLLHQNKCTFSIFTTLWALSEISMSCLCFLEIRQSSDGEKYCMVKRSSFTRQCICSLIFVIGIYWCLSSYSPFVETSVIIQTLFFKRLVYLKPFQWEL